MAKIERTISRIKKNRVGPKPGHVRKSLENQEEITPGNGGRWGFGTKEGPDGALNSSTHRERGRAVLGVN